MQRYRSTRLFVASLALVVPAALRRRRLDSTRSDHAPLREVLRRPRRHAVTR